MSIPNKEHNRVLDLTNPHVLSHLGFRTNQILGPIGAMTLKEIKEDARLSKHSHCAYRDPIRPGRLWVESLLPQPGKSIVPEVWQPMETAALVHRVLPGMLAAWEKETRPAVDWDLYYPPLSTPPLEYAQALEWLLRKYPDAVVVWVELALTYENDLKIFQALESLMDDCKARSKTWRITAEVLGLGAAPALDGFSEL